MLRLNITIIFNILYTNPETTYLLIPQRLAPSNRLGEALPKKQTWVTQPVHY